MSEHILHNIWINKDGHRSTKYSIPFVLSLVHISKLTSFVGSALVLFGTAEIFVTVRSFTRGSSSRTILDLKFRYFAMVFDGSLVIFACFWVNGK